MTLSAITCSPQKLADITKFPIITGYSVILMPINKSHLTLLFKWRNQAEIRQQMTNQSFITQEQHQKWFSSLHNNTHQQHFIIYYKTTAIGAINIKAIDNAPLAQCKTAEIGLYISYEKYKGNIIAFAPSLVINDYVFEYLKVNQLCSKVRTDNTAALKYNEQLGYEFEQQEKDFFAISLTKNNYHKKSKKLKSFLNRGKKIVDREA